MFETVSLRARMMITIAIIVLMAVPAIPAGALATGGEGATSPRVTDDAKSLTIQAGETYELSGCHTYTQSVQIDGILKVKPYDGSDATTGTLTLMAPVITIGTTGLITADGRGFGGGGGGSENHISGSGGKGGTGGLGGAGAAAGSYGGGGGGGSNGGLGGAPAYDGTAGAPGTETGGGKGGIDTSTGYVGGAGGTGFGGGGGGGGGWAGGTNAGGGGGGGSGGKNADAGLGANGGGPFGGTGGAIGVKGTDGGYAAAGTNGDTSTDQSILKGSGGGGGGTDEYRYLGGGGGGGAGGGSVALISSGDLTISGKISTNGGGGGFGGQDSNGLAGNGGGGAGGGVLLFGLDVSVTGTVDLQGRSGNTLGTSNGGTLKVFYDTDKTGTGAIQAGRTFKNGRPKMQGLTSPSNDGTGLVRTDFSWKAATDPEGDSVSYHIQVSDSGAFTSPIIDKQGLTQTEYTSETDLIGTAFYWRVRARDSIGYGSWTPAWKFLTDVTPPESHVNPLPVYTSSVNITVTWTGTDDSSGVAGYDIFVAEGGGSFSYVPWLEDYCKTSAVFEGKDGTRYNFYSVATDRGRNREADPAEPDTFTTIDVTPPVTTMSALSPFQGSLRFQLSWSSKDATSGVQYCNVYMADGESDFTILQEHYAKTSLEFDADDGHDYRFYIVTCDNAGNWEAMPSPSKILKTRVDLTPPEVALRLGNPNFGQDPVYLTAATQIYLDSTDNFAGVNVTSYNIDGRGAKAYANSIKEGAPGPHNMTYWATDKAGNKCEEGALWFFVDGESPTTVMSFEGPGFISGDKMFVTAQSFVVLTATDTGSGVNYIDYSLDKRSFSHYSAPLKFTAGSHNLVFKAQDKVGNIELEQTVTIIVDTLAPTTRTDGDFSTISKDDITVGLAPTDLDSGVAQTFFRVLREKERTGDFQAGTTVTVEASSGDGNYTVQYYSVDRVGNTEKVKELKLRIDTQVVLTLGFEGTPSVSSSKYILEGKTEPGAKMTIGINEVAVSADGSFSQELDLKPGKNTIVLEITDQAGNTRDQAVTVTYNQPVASADWFLPLVIIIVVVAVVGGAAYMYMRGKKGAKPPAKQPQGRAPPPAPPARAPPPKVPPTRAPPARVPARPPARPPAR